MTTQSYTPAQYLDAARRAEGDGKRDYAVQVYRYLSENFPGSQEGLAARDNLYRLGEMTRPRTAAEATGPRNGQGTTGAVSANSLRAALAAQTAQPVQAQIAYAPPATVESTRGQPATRSAEQSAAHAQAAALHEPLPQPSDAYAKSRVLAFVAGILGWIMFLIGLAMVLALLVTALTNSKVPFLLVPGFGFLAPGLLVGGGILGLLSQIARATFDSANAQRHLVAIERAKAGG